VFGLDDLIASHSSGAGLAIVALVAILLGLRHATDPDHLAAVTTLAAGRRGSAAELGLAWGVGHGLTLFAFGLPIVLFHAFLPERVQQGAETTIGLVIVALAVILLVRWRRGDFHVHVHPGTHRARTPAQAFAVGLVHGIGGSAGVGVLLVASIPSHAYAVVALALLASFTAVSMTALSTGFGAMLTRAPLARLAPALGVTSLAFGIWYALGAWALAPYWF
jgi:high-affinity nickel permease